MLEKLTLRSLDGPFSALTSGRVLGMTEPWIASGVDGAGVRHKVLLKLALNHFPDPRWPHHCLDMTVREFVCSVLLRRLSVPVPRSFLVDVPRMLAERCTHYPQAREWLLRSPWPHFATEYLENMADVQPGQRLSDPAHLEAAEDIFVADNLILNGDRSAKKPNLLYDPSRLVAIDHGMAFVLIRFGEPMDALPRPLQAAHSCYPTLKAAKPRFERVFARWVNEVSAQLLEDIRFALPAEWMHTSIDAHVILGHLRQHDSRLNRIANEIKLAFA